ncbi:hypothetical protein ACH9L7_08130 [Haloferax sp. S1W]|uniref:hypothetical protein n=1 Tax=Haloferax sp. S1W TaxID=3377110 RepID=UPI0037C8B15B
MSGELPVDAFCDLSLPTAVSMSPDGQTIAFTVSESDPEAVHPDEHHAVRKPERATHRLEQLLDWYERHDPAVEADD